jgi:hypothetical protein
MSLLKSLTTDSFVNGLYVKEWFTDSNKQTHSSIDTFKDPARTIYHNENGPASINYGANGKVDTERYHIDGRLHRDNDLPAYVSYHEDGTLHIQKWFKHGDLHRVGGPAEIVYNIDGSLSWKGWYHDGQEHREDGPAHIDYYPDTKEPKQLYFIEGCAIPKAKYLKKYLPIEYEKYLLEKIYTIDFKKYKITRRHGKQIVLEEV